MGPIEAALVVAALLLPGHLLIHWQAARACDLRDARGCGIVIRREEILERRAPVLGQYRGQSVHASVVFLGLEYRFDRVVMPAYRERVGGRELFVEPGLLYVTG